MKTLLISDRAPNNLSETLKNNQFDLIITLGDLEYFDVKELELVDIPKIGVFGNHCNKAMGGYMKIVGIHNLHLKIIKIGKLTFGGFEGSVRYKDGNYPMFTQDEARKLIRSLPKVDVLISHSPPFGINDNNDPAHQGLIGLKEYIDHFSPKYFMHGHTYDENGTFVKKYKDTEIIYVFQEKIIELI